MKSMSKHTHEHGGVSGTTLAIIGLVVMVLVAGSAAIWAYINYNEQKSNVDGKIELAVAEGKNQQADEDEKKFAEREKEPNREFVGPDDYGRLTFDYPKTWSAYEETDISGGGTYEAFLHPGVVPPISPSTQVSLRVTIEEKDYDQVVRKYERKVESGDLRSSGASANGHSGTRLDGNFDKNIRGAAVIYKIRDKTLTIRTDADTFKPDFERLIRTIDFND